MFNTVNDFLMTLVTVLFLLGVISIGIAIFILTRQALGRNIQTIAEQTTKLAQKGLTDDISGLVGNASSLMIALNDMAKSNTGIGIFLIIIGILMLLATFLIVVNTGLML